MIVDSLLSTSFRLASQLLLNLKTTHRLSLPAPRNGQSTMLYAHVPFCESLCPYCSFNRFIFNEPAARSYFASLREEMRMAAQKGYRFHSMYVGGGTPTILLDELAQSIDLARELFGLREVSCETNPNHLTPALVEALSSRVQRLSVGVQSFDDGLLKKLNRFQRFGSGAETLERLRETAGKFASLNIDLIFNIPGQDEAMLRRDLEAARTCGANQLTFYPLMTSPTVRRAIEHTVGEVEYSSEAAFYEIISTEMARDHELSTAWTFDRRGGGLIDEYIVESDEYLGIGSGSFSFLNGSLYVNTFSLDAYRAAIAAHRWPVTGMRRFARLDQMRYRFMMALFGLRLDKRKFQAQFGLPVELALPLETAFFIAAGAYAENSSDAITLTPRGRYLLVIMMREFFSSINRVRDQARQSISETGVETPHNILSESKAKA
jgi:coproporphyrinogen III oxidase-like Fe-S oxidoreductase